MRVVHFTLGSVDPDSLNGINRVVEGLACTMNSVGLAEVSVITVRRKMKDRGRQLFRREGFDVTACNSTAQALQLFAEIKSEIDLVHLHNAWSLPNVRVGAWLVQQGIPYVLTPHAAFLPDRMTRKTWQKFLFHRFMQKKLLDQAAALIAVSRDEIASIAPFTSNPRIEFVQNGTKGIDWQAHRDVLRDQDAVNVGYLGRIGREKNIRAMVEAAYLLPAHVKEHLRIKVFGNPDTDYGRDCKRLALSLGVSEVVEFRGEVSATAKWDALGTLDAYIQPSLSEAAPVAVLEAISMGLPIIATRTSGVSYWNGRPFLTMVEPVATELARGLETLFNNRNKLPEYGEQARTFYEQNFTWSIAARRQFEVYQRCFVGSATRLVSHKEVE